MPVLDIDPSVTLTPAQREYAAWLIAHIGEVVIAYGRREGDTYEFIIWEVAYDSGKVYYGAFFRERGTDQLLVRVTCNQTHYPLQDFSGSRLETLRVERAS